MNSRHSIKRTARNAVTAVKKHFSPAPPLPIVRFIAPKKILQLKLVTIKESDWLKSEYQSILTTYLEDAERIIDIKIDIVEESICDSVSKLFLLGNWDGIKNYAPEVVNLLNKYGTTDGLTLLLCNEIQGCQALAVLKEWAGKEDKLAKEGILLSSKAPENALSQILAKILSGERGWQISDDPNNLLCPLNTEGEEWGEASRIATQNSNYLK